jgi:hypothetical protein
VKWELAKPFHMKAFHISSANNCVADALSRGQFQKFKELAPEADTFPTAVPMEFWATSTVSKQLHIKIRQPCIIKNKRCPVKTFNKHFRYPQVIKYFFCNSD